MAALSETGSKGKYCWLPAVSTLRERYPSRSFDTDSRILAHLADGHSRTLHEVANHIDRLYDTVKKSVRRMAERGAVETYLHRGALYVRLPLADEDDGWTPPTNYIGGTREVILGLRRAA